MDRAAAPPIAVFAALSLALHAGALAATQRAHAVLPPVFEPTPGPLAGETLDVDPPQDEPEPAETPSDPAAAAPAARQARQAREPGPGSPVDPPPRTAGSAVAAAANAAPAPAVYGAAGVRYATDLATTFTRGFPQAASADATWGQVAFGAAGTAEVTLVIDDGGQLTSTTIDGAPSQALRRGIERTFALMRPRTFTARGAVTKLRLAARVSRDDVHDGLHGDVFALSGGSFSGDVGAAFFALPPGAGPGRRIDVELRLMR